MFDQNVVILSRIIILYFIFLYRIFFFFLYEKKNMNLYINNYIIIDFKKFESDFSFYILIFLIPSI